VTAARSTPDRRATRRAGSAGRARAGTDDAGRARLGAASGAGLGVAVLWLSLLVALPLAAVVAKGAGSGFWDAITAHPALAAIRLTVLSALAVAAVDAVMGTLVAWVLVRDCFPGKRLVEAVIDIPFALPTIVGGLVLLTLYGQQSAIGLDWYATRRGVLVALLFVTLPFVVRTVQPVLLAFDREAEEAAASLGAAPLTAFRRIVLPVIAPAVAAGAALAFGRAMGEYGSVLLISGGLPRASVASQYVYSQIQNDEFADAAAVSTLLLLISVAVLALLGEVQRRAARRG
jgi:sulfate/thiosulfate transport system permease protein